MRLSISTRLGWRCTEPTDILLQIEAARLPTQRIRESSLECTEAAHFARVPALDGVGERIWLHHDGEFEVRYSATVAIRRTAPDLAALAALPPHRLPGEAVPYLMDSHYCPASRFGPFVADEFDGVEGGAKIAAMRDWVAAHFNYQPGTSTAQTTAVDTFVERRGVCRDYAHVMIALARAAAIPARFASGYGPDVDPQDFHAVAEVFLADDEDGSGGAWHLVDATGMGRGDAFARIGVGRDATDASFLTSYGAAMLTSMEIAVAALPPARG